MHLFVPSEPEEAGVGLFVAALPVDPAMGPMSLTATAQLGTVPLAPMCPQPAGPEGPSSTFYWTHGFIMSCLHPGSQSTQALSEVYTDDR
ncbi:unnamed protein product [Boreogadus saida]